MKQLEIVERKGWIEALRRNFKKKKMRKIDLYNEGKPRKRNKRSGAFRAVIKGTANQDCTWRYRACVSSCLS